MNDTSVVAVPAQTVPAGHEDPSVDTRALLIWAAGLMASIVIGCLAAHWMFTSSQPPADEVGAPAQKGEDIALPPAPRLEGLEMSSRAPAGVVNPLGNRVNTYGWVDREKGTVHIPIERAMDLAIERGWLPSKAKAPPNGDARSPLDPNTVAPMHSTQ